MIKGSLKRRGDRGDAEWNLFATARVGNDFYVGPLNCNQHKGKTAIKKRKHGGHLWVRQKKEKGEETLPVAKRIRVGVNQRHSKTEVHDARKKTK